MKWVLKTSCKNGTVHTSMSKAIDEPTAYCIHLFEKIPMLEATLSLSGQCRHGIIRTERGS